MSVHKFAGDVKRGFRYHLFQEDGFHVSLKSFQQVGYNCTGNLACTLSPPKG